MGVTAVDARTGELLWYSENLGCLDMLLRDSTMKSSVDNWYQNYCNSNNNSIIFENSTIGTLSTDNVRVYAVDDLGIPPHPGAQQQWNGGAPAPTGKLLSLMQHNSLVAIELDSGKIAWERGDRERGDTTGLADSFFLGPPLPIAGQLYALTEKELGAAAW